MSPERWQAIDELLQATLERAPAERATFLAEACGQDHELRREVESLLDFHQTTNEDFLETPPAAVATALVEQKGTEELLLGHTFDRYELLRAIGRGGMGTVYLAQDKQLGRQVALKLLPRRFARDIERVRRFRQEARAISALNHPNILTIHEIGQTTLAEREFHFLATEYVEGRTLRALLNDSSLTLGNALDLALQTARALQAAHTAGIIHRDIKPENIMVRPDGLVKVLDFGLAKFLRVRSAEGGVRSEKYLKTLTSTEANTPHSALNTPHLTAPGVVMGTISYMSPEQARGLDVDARSDLFSLGVVLYEMVTGQAPFAGATSSDVLASILEREPPPLKQTAPQAPVALQSILARALAKNRDARYQQADDLLHDLMELKQELELAARVKRSGDAPTSLDLRATPPVEGATARTTQGEAPRLTSQRKRLARPMRWLAATFAVIVSGFAGVGLYRHWWVPMVNGNAINSIAVLPFVNANADTAMEYLPDGITENLMQRLQQLPGMRVMARGTVFSYKGREVDPREIGQALHVSAVVTGRVQRQGDRLLITVELADTRDGAQLWSERYQRPLTELLAVQAEMARALSTQLAPQISAQQKQQLGKDYTGNAEAYRLYLLGRYHFNQYTQEAGLKALDYYQQAIALDPTYALAYAGVADIYTDFSSRYVSPGEAMPKARQAALKALELDNNLAEAHHSLALIKIWGDWDWVGAEQDFKQALALNPNLAVTHAIYGNTLSFQRRFDEARREIRLAQQLDPLSTLAAEMMGWTLYFERRYDEAITEFRKLRELDPTYHRATLHLAENYRQKGQLNEAIAEVQKELARQRTDAALGLLAYLYAANGQSNEARKLLIELEQIARQRWVSPVTLAKIHIGLNEPERALTRLREAYDAHSEFLFALGVDPIFDPLRNDPRFIELSRGVGLTP